MSKSNILFYSPDCEYSVQVMKMIDTFRIRDHFVIVNINNPEYKLPSFVECVPLIFIKGQNQIVIDDNIPQFLETLRGHNTRPMGNGNGMQQQQQQQQQQSHQHQDQGITAVATQSADGMMSMSDISRGFSDNFSFINDGDSSMAPKNFVFIEGNNRSFDIAPGTGNAGNAGSQRMPDPQDASKSNKFDSQELERFNSQRNQDDELFKKQNPR
jgi:hypothetical protein